jgi:S-formylglutathione hydrolase FrmB
MRALRMAIVATAAWLLFAPGADAAGVQLVGQQRIDARMLELTLRTPAVSGPTKVRVLLPSGYGRGTRRYPVLYLLHGAVDNYRSWTDKGDAEALTAGRPLIVVMPDSGPGGGYVNWWNGGLQGPPAWETYHLRQLIPFVDRRFRTVGRRAGRAVAGLSMGGFGAMSYAARHPDLFTAAAAFSGAVDTGNGGIKAVTGDAVYGPTATQQVRWRGSNPVDLAPNLRGVQLSLRTGDGRPGGPFGGGPDGIEAVVHTANVTLHQRLRALRIPHLWDDYGPGTHTWPYWRRDLQQTLPRLMAAFRRGSRPTARFTYRAISPRYRIYGWRVAVKRPALEFSTLRSHARNGFSLTGSGTAHVVTARLFPARTRVLVTARFSFGKPRHTVVRADPSGRLTLTLTLGPGNTAQEDTAGARTSRYTTRVALTRAR